MEQLKLEILFKVEFYVVLFTQLSRSKYMSMLSKRLKNNKEPKFFAEAKDAIEKVILSNLQLFKSHQIHNLLKNNFSVLSFS